MERNNFEMMGVFDDIRSWFAKQDTGIQDVISTAAQRLVFGGQTEEQLKASQAKEKLMKQIIVAGGIGVGVLGIVLIMARPRKKQ